MISLGLLFDPKILITSLGILGVIAIIFAETGLFFGFFLPGDSLLFTAGFLASQGYVSLTLLLLGCFLAAVAGDSVGYAFGRKIGPALFTKEDSFLFNKKHIQRAEEFFEKHGKKTIILARFVPVVRTFAPIIAGIGKMDYKIFLSFNLAGGLLWTWLFLWLGYGFGSVIPNPDHYVIPAVIVIIALSAVPPLWEVIKSRRHR